MRPPPALTIAMTVFVLAALPGPAVAQVTPASRLRLVEIAAESGIRSLPPTLGVRRQRDGIGDGVLKGALIGAVIGVVIGAIGAADSDSGSCAPGALGCGDQIVSDAVVVLGMTALGAGVGAAMGGIADALHERSSLGIVGRGRIRIVNKTSSRRVGAGIIVRW